MQQRNSYHRHGTLVAVSWIPIYNNGCNNKYAVEGMGYSPGKRETLMKYILKKKFALRGYNAGNQKVLEDLTDGKRISLSDTAMNILKLCDGETDFDQYCLLPVFNQMAEYFFRKGWVEDANAGQRLLPEQVYQTVQLPNIRVAQWSITGRCNARCRHCFIASSQKTHTDLNTEEMIHIQNVLAENQVTELVLTGGEPLLREDLPLLLDETAKHGQKIKAVSTNGFLLSDSMIDQFLSRGMHPRFDISFDGPGHHDWIRGVEGAEQMVTAAAESCRRKKIEFGFNMCVHHGNVHLIVPAIHRAAELGAKRIRISPVGDFGGFSSDEGILPLSFSEAAPIFLKAAKEAAADKPDIDIEFCGFLKFCGKEPAKYSISPLEHCCTDLGRNRVCEAACSTCYISDEGRLLPCMAVAGSAEEQNFYRLTEHSFDECLNHSFYREFLNQRSDTLIQRNPECAGCEYLPSCGCGCRGASLALHGHLYGVDEERCTFFRNHWPEKIREAMDLCLADSGSEDNKPT